MSSHGFLYYLAGGKNAAQLLVSIYSVRSAGHGDPILICAGDDEGEDYAQKIAKETRLLPEIRVKRITNECISQKKRKGRQHCGKAAMGRWTEFDKTIFLDADTAVVGNLRDLWPGPSEVILTQFATWKTTGGMMSGRLRRYREQLPKQVAMMTSTPYPAINTGVMSWDKGATGFHKAWQDVCLGTAFKDTMPFMGDEITANLLFPEYPHQVLDHRWNYSPVFSIKDEVRDDVRVWHFHGQKHLRAGPARSTWAPLYRDVAENNLADIQSWTPARDKSLKKWLDEGQPDG
jgi:hypothetical protein